MLYHKLCRPELKPVEKESEVVLKFPEADKLSPPILQLDEATFHYVPDKPVFTNVNVNANMESRVCIVSVASPVSLHCHDNSKY